MDSPAKRIALGICRVFELPLTLAVWLASILFVARGRREWIDERQARAVVGLVSVALFGFSLGNRSGFTLTVRGAQPFIIAALVSPWLAYLVRVALDRGLFDRRTATSSSRATRRHQAP